MGIETPCTIIFTSPELTLDEGRYLRTDLPPGSAWWVKWYDREEYAGLRFSCPCGCGCVGMFRIGSGHSKSPWQWDGNLLAPTFTPSMQVYFPCRWHGYLSKGVFRTE